MRECPCGKWTDNPLENWKGLTFGEVELLEALDQGVAVHDADGDCILAVVSYDEAVAGGVDVEEYEDFIRYIAEESEADDVFFYAYGDPGAPKFYYTSYEQVEVDASWEFAPVTDEEVQAAIASIVGHTDH